MLEWTLGLKRLAYSRIDLSLCCSISLHLKGTWETHSCQPAKTKSRDISEKSGICGSKIGTFPYKVKTFPYMVNITNVRWRDNNRNPQIFGETALRKAGLSL